MSNQSSSLYANLKIHIISLFFHQEYNFFSLLLCIFGNFRPSYLLKVDVFGVYEMYQRIMICYFFLEKHAFSCLE